MQGASRHDRPDTPPLSRGRRRGGAVEHRFLIHKRGDHVGVAVADMAPGERVVGIFMDDDSSIELDVLEAVPLGHKIAIEAVGADEPVLEYGIQIGVAPTGFVTGAHVHVHNIRSARW
jgi:(2R)-sulfolactate sulfo-lyase subunit alpha